MIGSFLSIVDRKYLFTIVIVQTHFSEVAVDTDLARRKSGDFFSCKGLVKKYREGGWAGAERGWVTLFYYIDRH